MKSLILKHTKIYLLFCWLILWTIGSLIGLSASVNTFLVLVVGYLVNVIWLMRLTSEIPPQAEAARRGEKLYSRTIVES